MSQSCDRAIGSKFNEEAGFLSRHHCDIEACYDRDDDG